MPPAKKEKKRLFDFWGGIKESFTTIPENLAGVAGTFLDPLGISVGDVSSIETASEELEVGKGVFGSMIKLFDGKIGAFAYLLFILLYFPCLAAIAAVYRETNIRWTIFSGVWTTVIGYMAATLFYQVATIGRHAASSLVWIAVLIAIFIFAVFVMRYLGSRGEKTDYTVLETAKATVKA